MKTIVVESSMFIRKFDEILFDIILVEGHHLQKYCATPKGFYQQKKHIIFVGDRLTGGTVRIRVAIKDILSIKIAYGYETEH